MLKIRFSEEEGVFRSVGDNPGILVVRVCPRVEKLLEDEREPEKVFSLVVDPRVSALASPETVERVKAGVESGVRLRQDDGTLTVEVTGKEFCDALEDWRSLHCAGLLVIKIMENAVKEWAAFGEFGLIACAAMWCMAMRELLELRADTLEQEGGG